MRPKIEAVFDHSAAQSEYYKRANIVQRFAMDASYQLMMDRSTSGTGCSVVPFRQ
jgi:hypothetical protein